MALPDVQNYLLSVENREAEALSIAGRTAQRLQSGEVSLLDVVHSLGEYINDGDSKIRGRAVSYLTAVLSVLPPKYLSRQQIDVLCQFLNDRIEDIGAIDGLIKLQSLDRFSNEMAQTVVRAIFEHFPDFRGRPQSERHHILRLLNELMANRRQALKTMGDESLLGFTNLVSGEKDPRNLMLVFSMCRVFMLEWDISNHAEILFDSVYAYFPITFRPPPNDPHRITAQDLKDRLRDCISSTKYLAPYAIPNLLDKLDSTSPVIKKDVIRTILACVRTYAASELSQYSITLWDALKFEVLSAQEPELADETLVVLREIALCLSTSTQTSATASPLAQYIRPITKECIEHLHEPAQRQAKASGDILRAVSCANLETFNLIARAVIAPIITIYRSTSEVAKQRALLDVLNQILDSSVDVFGTWTSKTALRAANPLEAFSESFLEIFSQALLGAAEAEFSLRIAAANGLKRLAVVRDLLPDNEIGLVIQHLDDIVLEEKSTARDDLKTTALETLAELSKHKPRLIMDITLPAFLAHLPDTETEAEARGDYLSTLEGLAKISVEKEVFDTLTRRLLNKVDLLLNAHNVDSPKYTCALLSTLLFVMERRRSEESNMNVQSYYDRIVIGLMSRATKAAEAAAAGETTYLTALNDVAVLEVLGRISNHIIRHSTPKVKAEACANVYDLFSLSPSGFEKLSTAPKCSPLQRIWTLSTWTLAALPLKDNDSASPLLETATISSTIPKLVSLLHGNKEIGPIAFLAISRQLALYINKHLPNSALEIPTAQLKMLYTTLSSIHQEEEQGQQQQQQQQNHNLDQGAGLQDSISRGIRIIFTISKALILRLSPNTQPVLEDLLSLLDASRYPPAVNAAAASSFGLLLAPDDVLSKANGAQIRLLAPQRVFRTVAPMIAAGFRSTSSSSSSSSQQGMGKENYLTALSGLIATIPSDIVISELSTLLPLLLQSLDLADQRVKVATLQTLATVIATSPASLDESGHVPSLVKRLLKTAVISKGATNNESPPDVPAARQHAVRCLFLMPSHIKGSGSRSNPLLPLKREVSQGLVQVLDDPKRDVRKQAVDARSAWLRGVDDVEDESD